MLRIHNKVVVSTFAGQDSLFGHQTFEHAWGCVKARLEAFVPIHFVPSFFIDPAKYILVYAMDGTFNWNGSWPLHLSDSSPREEVLQAARSLTTDGHHLSHLRKDMGMTYMAAVSPWFFTHYGAESWNKNWLFRCDDHLFMERWEQLIASREEIDLVQVISWNDYGESHYISSVRGAQPNSQAWVDGYPHVAFLKMTAYYARAFKEGQYPPIRKDELFVWARPHAKRARCLDLNEEAKVGKPKGWDLVEDRCWVGVFSSVPAESSQTVIKFEAIAPGDGRVILREECYVSYGIFKLSFPLITDTGIKVSLRRQGTEIIRVAPTLEEYCFASRPKVYNFNAWTGYASN